MSTLWGGRFEKTLDDAAKALSYSLSFDQRLLPYDIRVNRAHIDGLTRSGYLTPTEQTSLHRALDDVETMGPSALAHHPDDEDVHSFVERLVIESVGDLGKKMHAGKSRNDQVATDVRLYTKDAIHTIDGLMLDTLKAVYEFANTHRKVIFPGFTHLQVAQPIVLGHHALAYFEKLQRDRHRLTHALTSADSCPLGAAAMAGTNYAIDRMAVAKALSFSSITQNSMDAVSDRDFIFDLLYSASMITLHLSQWCEELIFWSSSVVGFITIGDEFTTGSSIMPQKKNPDIAELIRGQCGSILGQFVSMHEIVKGLPLTYNRDLQDDKQLLFRVVDIMIDVLTCFSRMIPTISIQPDAIQKALNTGHLLATEMADYLVLKQVPFRDAHELVGRMVRLADSRGCQVHALPIEELQRIAPVIDHDIASWLTMDTAVNRKNVVGATSMSGVTHQLNKIKELYKW